MSGSLIFTFKNGSLNFAIFIKIYRLLFFAITVVYINLQFLVIPYINNEIQAVSAARRHVPIVKGN